MPNISVKRVLIICPFPRLGLLPQH